MPTAAALALETEARARLPEGDEERFAGYGVMGLPFASGHVLAMRRFAASSVGPGYTSVWHRDPAGRWEFWQDQPAALACPRYFSAALAATREVAIGLEWTGPGTMRLAVPEMEFEWTTTVRATPITRGLSAVAAMLPERWRKAKPVLSMMAPVAGALLRAGRVGLQGVAPNGQRFIANPMKLWLVAEARATLAGHDFGSIGPLAAQAALGDFWIPQRGIFAVGHAFFRPA